MNRLFKFKSSHSRSDIPPDLPPSKSTAPQSQTQQQPAARPTRVRFAEQPPSDSAPAGAAAAPRARKLSLQGWLPSSTPTAAFNATAPQPNKLQKQRKRRYSTGGDHLHALQVRECIVCGVEPGNKLRGKLSQPKKAREIVAQLNSLQEHDQSHGSTSVQPASTTMPTRAVCLAASTPVEAPDKDLSFVNLLSSTSISPEGYIATASTQAASDALDFIGGAASAFLKDGQLVLPQDRITVVATWWGFEVAIPAKSMHYLASAKSISGTLFTFLQACATYGGMPELLPFIRYISFWIQLEFGAIAQQDKGSGVILAATWLMPLAMVPRPWDYSLEPPGPTTPSQPKFSQPQSGLQQEAAAPERPQERRPSATPADMVPFFPQAEAQPAALQPDLAQSSSSPARLAIDELSASHSSSSETDQSPISAQSSDPFAPSPQFAQPAAMHQIPELRMTPPTPTIDLPDSTEPQSDTQPGEARSPAADWSATTDLPRTGS